MREIQPSLNETVSPIQIFSLLADLEELLEFKVEQSKFYSHQNGRNFAVTKEEKKAFFGINFIIAINKLPTVDKYRRIDNMTGNDGIQNKMI